MQKLTSAVQSLLGALQASKGAPGGDVATEEGSEPGSTGDDSKAAAAQNLLGVLKGLQGASQPDGDTEEKSEGNQSPGNAVQSLIGALKSSGIMPQAISNATKSSGESSEGGDSDRGGPNPLDIVTGVLGLFGSSNSAPKPKSESEKSTGENTEGAEKTVEKADEKEGESENKTPDAPESAAEPGAGDKQKPDIQQLTRTLETLLGKLKEAGKTPQP